MQHISPRIHTLLTLTFSLILLPLLITTIRTTVLAEEVILEEKEQEEELDSPETVCYNFRLAGTAYKDMNDSGAYEEGKDEILSGQSNLITVEGVNVNYGPYTVSTYSAGTYSFGGLRTGTYRITGREVEGGWITDAQELVVECPEPNYEYQVNMGYSINNGTPTPTPNSYDFSDFPLHLFNESLTDQVEDDSQWLELNPGRGKTSFRIMIFMPRDFPQRVGQDPNDPKFSDAELRSRIRPMVQSAINDYQTKANITSVIEPDIIIHRSPHTINYLLCGSESWCYPDEDEYRTFTNNINLLYRELEPNWQTKYGLAYVFGGSGIGGTTDEAIIVGDWMFANELFQYSAIGCYENPSQCLSDDGKKGLRHELIHAYGVGWHAPEYSTYPAKSISGGGEWNNFTFANHPGYPEKYLLCMSSLNVGTKNCAAQFQNPNRPLINFPQPNLLMGRLTIPGCEEYDTNYKVFFSKSDKGIGWGRRYLIDSANLTSNGSFAIPISTQLYTWQTGYAIYPALEFPNRLVDVNEFVTQYQLFYNPNNGQFCNQHSNSTPCHPHTNLVLESTVPEICLRVSTPTPTPTATLTLTPTPTSGLFPTGTNGYPGGTIACLQGGVPQNLPNGRASAQVISPNMSDIGSTNANSQYNLYVPLLGHGSLYPYIMKFSQYVPGTSTVHSTNNVTFYFRSNGQIILNGQTMNPNLFHHQFSSCASSPPPTATNTPTPTPTMPSTPFPIQGSIACQSNPGNMAGKTMYLYKGSNIVAQNTVFYGNTGSSGAYGFNYNTNFTDGYYAIRPASGPESCGFWFCPNNGGTYECIHRRSNGDIIAKRNASGCADASNPQVWCGSNPSLANCWMVVNPTTMGFTATSCGGGSNPPTHTPTPTPTTAQCVTSSITGSLGIIEKVGSGSTVMPNPGYEAALLLDHYQSSGPAPHYMEIVVNKTDVNNQSQGTQRVYERFLNQNPLDPNSTNLIRFTDWDRNVNWATTDVIMHYSQPICGTNSTTKTQRVAPEQVPITRIMGRQDTVTDPCVISGYFRSEAADFQNYLNYVNGQIPAQSGVPITMEIYTGGYPAPYGNGQLMTLPNGQTQFSANQYRSDLATRWGSAYANHGYSLDLRNSPVANGTYQVLYLKLINPQNTVGQTEYYPLPFQCAP